MSDLSGRSEIDRQVKCLQELLDKARLTSLDHDNREHLHIIQLCLDMAIDRLIMIR